jgi:D-proline reductase (dithiol) PrdB
MNVLENGKSHHNKRNTSKMTMRPTPDVEIFENPKQWLISYRDGWLEHLEKTGQIDWSKYVRPQNGRAPSGSGVDLGKSRLMLVTSSGAYLRTDQEPFEDENPFGDFHIRTFPSDTPLSSIAFSHQHYDHIFVKQDPQVLLPLGHLRNMVREGSIGELAPSVVSFNGYLPNVLRIVKELLPHILSVAQEEEVNAILLVPASNLCIQSVGLLARGLELNRIATTLTSWSAGLSLMTAPPRATATNTLPGCPMGAPGDEAQQRRILEATLALLEKDAPVNVVQLDEISNHGLT